MGEPRVDSASDTVGMPARGGSAAGPGDATYAPLDAPAPGSEGRAALDSKADTLRGSESPEMSIGRGRTIPSGGALVEHESATVRGTSASIAFREGLGRAAGKPLVLSDALQGAATMRSEGELRSATESPVARRVGGS